jgi:hypothetical protein
VKAALLKVAPNVPVTIASEKPQGNFNAIVLSGSNTLAAPGWIRSFDGIRIIVPNESQGLIWVGGVDKSWTDEAAQTIRQLAEGQKIRQQRVNPAWQLVIYITAALFGLQFLFLIVALIFSAFVH